MHGLRDQIFAQDRPIPSPPIAIARPGRASSPFELNVKASLRPDDLAQKHRPPIAQLRVPMAKLMARIGLGYRICALRNLIARHKQWPVFTKGDAQLLGMFRIEHQSFRSCNCHRRLACEHLRR